MTRTAVVTGGSAGIGLATASRLLADGYAVVITGRDEGRLAAAAEGLGSSGELSFLVLDAFDHETTAERISEIKPDVLVANVGMGFSGDLAHTSLDDWHRVLGTNVTSAFVSVHACAPHMLERGWGRIVLEGTEAGGPEYGALIEESWSCLHALAGARLEPFDAAELLADVIRLRERLEDAQVPEALQPFGRRFDLPGCGQLFAPVHKVVDRGEDWVLESVTLRRFYLGGAGFAHGGVVPLLFDEVMGELVKHHGSGVHAYRTRFLDVEYLSVVPLDVRLHVRVRLTRAEGRKHFLEGTLEHGSTVCAAPRPSSSDSVRGRRDDDRRRPGRSGLTSEQGAKWRINQPSGC